MDNIISDKILFPIFDKVYNSKAEAINNASTDNVLIGRFVLIKYTDDEMRPEQKNIIINSEGNGLSGDDLQFWNNYQADHPGGIKDRMLLQKVAEKQDGQYVLTYKEICSFSNPTTDQIHTAIELWKKEIVDAIKAAKDNKDEWPFIQDIEASIEQLKTSYQNLVNQYVWDDTYLN